METMMSDGHELANAGPELPMLETMTLSSELPTAPHSAPASPAPAAAEPEDFDAVCDVPVKVEAVLGRSKMEIGELLRLRPGDVVELDRRVGEPADILVNNRLIARGEVVMIENSLGVTLTEIVRQPR